MNLLFVCTANKLRSATAETIFNQVEGIEAIGAGTNKTAPTTLSNDLIVLDIPDDYDYMDEKLIILLKRKIGDLLGARFLE
ncbi:MAG: hypothetical protein KDI90_05040 [Alphaproteobacteria bacterium]|nr:hypothetical protein [Alphaproteobacteria bacterium]MCB9975089.1 hypothetical protein [Rhodospirillales bacterium]